MVEVWQEVRSIVHREFYDPDGLAGFAAVEKRYSVEWDRERQEVAGPPDARAQLAIAEGLRALGVSHTQRYTPDEIDYYELLDIYSRSTFPDEVRRRFPPEGKVHYPGVGIAVENIAGSLFVSHIYSGGPAETAGLLTGDELLEVDGKPFEPIRSFRGKAGAQSIFRIRRQATGDPIALDIPVLEIEPEKVFVDAIERSVQVFQRNGYALGYVRLWAYSFPGISDLLARLLSERPLSDASGLVLDLRCRWGGAPPDAVEIFGGTMPELKFVLPDGDEVIAEREQPGAVYWRKPVVALIDQGTRSGMEILAYALQRAGVPLVGAESAGAVIGGKAYLLKDGSLLSLAAVGTLVDGTRLEGEGVSPDIAVPFSLPYSQGHDPRLDRALEELSSVVGRTSAAGR